MSKRAQRPRARSRAHAFERRALDAQELRAILERARTAPLSGEDHDKLTAAIDTLTFITQLVEAEDVSGKQLRALLFGPEPADPQHPTPASPDTASGAGPGCATSVGIPGADHTHAEGGSPTPEKPRRKGHGRNGRERYAGAPHVQVTHPTLRHKDRCPECGRGKVYEQATPATLVRIKGMAPFQGTVYEQQRLRCNLCGEVFTAPPPAGVGTEKYDETVAAMLVLLHYGAGFPFHRLDVLQRALGIPLPAGTQWEEIAAYAPAAVPAHHELVRQAAQGEVLYHDDTAMRVLALAAEIQQEIAAGTSERTGVFTSGIVSTREEHQIALFYTGRQHAGEHLVELLKAREAERPPPIQMCDASARNTPADLQTILAHCTAHARRHFGDVESNFPVECHHVLEVFRGVYRIDARARAEQMTAEERLGLHQAESGPLMVELKQWMRTKLDAHEVEPNSGLGDAMKYMLDHWEPLTLFLRVAGAPLDNNICERALKKAIRHRRNSLFYKTENGARVGDMFMSLIHTAELNGTNPFDYLVALLRHPKEVSKEPTQWMPWNYRDTLAGLAAPPQTGGAPAG
jgi:transposase